MTTVTADATRGGASMVELVLTAQESEELRLALESYLADLRLEIAHTDGYDFRQALKQRRTVLQAVLGHLAKDQEVSPAGHSRPKPQ